MKFGWRKYQIYCNEKTIDFGNYSISRTGQMMKSRNHLTKEFVKHSELPSTQSFSKTKYKKQLKNRTWTLIYRVHVSILFFKFDLVLWPCLLKKRVNLVMPIFEGPLKRPEHPSNFKRIERKWPNVGKLWWLKTPPESKSRDWIHRFLEYMTTHKNVWAYDRWELGRGRGKKGQGTPSTV